jgi:hypothetical protein
LLILHDDSAFELSMFGHVPALFRCAERRRRLDHERKLDRAVFAHAYHIQNGPTAKATAWARWEYDATLDASKYNYYRHHLHLLAGLPIDGGQIDLDKAHLPTGWVTRAGLPPAVVGRSGHAVLLSYGQHAQQLSLAADLAVARRPCNPVDTSDVADYLAECLDDGKLGMRDEIGGPEIKSFAEFGRQFQRARGFRRRIASIRVSEKTALKMGFVKTINGRRGKKTWEEWLGD